MNGFPTEDNDNTATEWSFSEPLGTPLPRAPRRRRRMSGALAAGLLVTTGAGIAIGHLAWAGSGSPLETASPAGNGTAQGNVQPQGGQSGFFGNFGNLGNSGSSNSSGSTSSDGPTNAQAIAAAVDKGLVDVNVTLGDSGAGAAAAGTGMVLTSDGVVLTNNHVIDGATAISVYDVGNGKTYQATVAGYDVQDDIAVLRLVNASGLGTVKIGNSSNVKQGDQVVAVGNAGGRGGTPSYAGGTITGLKQSITASDDSAGTDEQLKGLLATNADIQPGDSGGPLVNSSGAVIGIDTAGSSSSGFSQPSATGQGFAIPINSATSIAGQIRSGVRSDRVHIGKTAFLGVEIGAGSSTSTGNGSGSNFGGNGFGGGFYFGGGQFSGNPIGSDPFGGVGSGGVQSGGSSSGSTTSPGPAQIAGTVANGPAARAGLVEGDTITSVNGKSVNSSTLSDQLMKLRVGATARIGYTTASGASQSVNVTLASGPPR